MTFRDCLILACVAAGAAGCASQPQLEDVQTTEYLQSRPGKPLVYPPGVAAPDKSRVYSIPDLPADADRDYDLNKLARPPELFDHSVLEDEEESEDL